MSLDEKITGFFYSAAAGANRVADNIDRHADRLAGKLRDQLSGSSWLPSINSTRYSPSPPPPPPTAVSTSLSKSVQKWASEHRWTVILGVAGLTSFGTWTTLKRFRRPPKRRAQRAPNGARKEVVVVAGGSPHDILTKTLTVDLERRGFIVFVVVNSIDDEHIVLNTGGRDLRPLHIDLLDPEAAQLSVDKFTAYLQGGSGSSANQLHFAGMILMAATADSPHHRHSHPTGPVESIPPTDLSDTLNLRLLSPFVTIQLFLRTLRSSSDSRLLVLTPAMISALRPAFHAPESAAVAAIDAFTTCLRRELKPLGIAVTQLKLGTFDLTLHGRIPAAAVNAARADIIGWPPALRSAYARMYAAMEGSKVTMRGSNLKELYVAVFDALTAKRPDTLVRVGRGSWKYEVLGRWAPDGLVAWMLGAGWSGSKDIGGGRPFPGGAAAQGSLEWDGSGEA